MLEVKIDTNLNKALLDFSNRDIKKIPPINVENMNVSNIIFMIIILLSIDFSKYDILSTYNSNYISNHMTSRHVI
jgi:hypothetical protein